MTPITLPSTEGQYAPHDVQVIGGMDGARLLFACDPDGHAARFPTFDAAWAARKVAVSMTNSILWLVCHGERS